MLFSPADDSHSYQRDTIYSIYYIFSPVTGDHYNQNESKHRYLPILLSLKNSKTGVIEGFANIKVSLSMLPFLAVGDVINKEGALDSRRFSERVFTISDPMNQHIYQTTESDSMLARFFQFDQPLLKLQKEQFLRLNTVDHKNIYIPVIEVVRYFYANTPSMSELTLSPRGIGNTYEFYEYNPIEDKHYLNLQEYIKYYDRHKLFYFIHKDQYATMFNSVFYNWNETGILQVPIPFDPDDLTPLEFKADYKQLENTNNYLILKIKQSNHLQVELNNKNLSMYHARKNRAQDISNDENGDVEFHRRKAKVNRELDTDSKTDSMLNSEFIYDDGLDEVNMWEFSLNEEQREGEAFGANLKIVNHSEEGDEVGLSTNEGLSSKGTSARLEIDRENLEIVDGAVVNLDGLIEELTMRGFRVGEIDGIFENTINNKAITDYKAQAYADPLLTVRRSYKLLSVTAEDGELFYLLDAQEREPDHFMGGTQNTRPGILLFPAPDCENFEEQFVKPLLANIVINGGSWFTRKTRSDKLSPIDSIYEYNNQTLSLRHIENPERFADSILRAVDKLKRKRNTE